MSGDAVNLFISDAQFNSIALIIIALIGIIPATLAAYWSRSAKKQAGEAKDNSAEARTNSAEARENSANALHEVRTNGGMSDPNPNLNDHVKYQTQLTEWIVDRVQDLGVHVQEVDKKLDDHLQHSRLMDQALAQVYMVVRPDTKEWSRDSQSQKPPH